MSYDITFVKFSHLTLDNAYDVLEMTDVDPSSETYVSRDEMESIIAEIANIGIEFDQFEGKDGSHFELNFPSYQVFLFHSQLAISVPYWDENNSEKIDKEIKQISNVFLNNGFRGFDSQTEEIIESPYTFQQTFSETKAIVDSARPKEKSIIGNNMLYIGIGFLIVITLFVIFKLVKR